MAVFDHIPAGETGLRDVYRWLDDFVATHEQVARKEIIGKSEENRDIPAIFLTNASIPERDKEIAIVIGTVGGCAIATPTARAPSARGSKCTKSTA